MRATLLLSFLLAGFSGPLTAQDEPETSPTEALKDSIREWIETMREIQKEEDSWEEDRVLLDDQRAALRAEIEELKGQIKEAKEDQAGADKESLEKITTRDAYLKAQELLSGQVRELETGVLESLPGLPDVLVKQPRMETLIKEIRSSAKLSGEAAKGKLAKRLNNVLNLLGEAGKFQQTVHLRDELHQQEGSGEYNMKVVYFGLAVAYAVNESGDFALVGKPTSNGWEYHERSQLAPQVSELVDVLTGDADAKFISLPISHP